MVIHVIKNNQYEKIVSYIHGVLGLHNPPIGITYAVYAYYSVDFFLDVCIYIVYVASQERCIRHIRDDMMSAVINYAHGGVHLSMDTSQTVPYTKTYKKKTRESITN